jgi:hypothetical protein
LALAPAITAAIGDSGLAAVEWHPGCITDSDAYCWAASASSYVSALPVPDLIARKI